MNSGSANPEFFICCLSSWKRRKQACFRRFCTFIIRQEQACFKYLIQIVCFIRNYPTIPGKNWDNPVVHVLRSRWQFWDAGCIDLYPSHRNYLPVLTEELCQRNCRSSEIMNQKYCLDRKEWEEAQALIRKKTEK